MTVPVGAPDVPAGLQHKTAVVEDAPPVVAVDEAAGEVTAIVSVTNVVDEVGDVIEPGAYTATLAKRRPKGVWSHSWKDWVARTEEITEYRPGDQTLRKMIDDANTARAEKNLPAAVFPADAGALVVRTKFNLKDPDSVKAFEKVKFFSETGECQWSIGYSVPPGKASRDKAGVRRIKALELFEYSPVLFGAASQSGTLSVKSLVDDDTPRVPGSEAAELDLTNLFLEATPDIDAELAEAGVVFPPVPEGSPSKEDTDGDGDADGPPVDPDHPPAADQPADDPDAPPVEEKRKFTADQRDKAASKGQAMPGGGFPIKNEQDLKNAIQAVGRAKDPAAAKAHIIRRARALGLSNLIPDGWQSEKKELEEKVRHGGGGNAETLRDYWENGEGAAKIGWGTPGDFMRCVAAVSKYMPAEKAKGYCNLRHTAALGVPPGQEKSAAWDPALEVGDDAAHLPAASGPQVVPDPVVLTGTEFPIEGKDIPYLAGSWEERREALARAVRMVLGSKADDGTWVIVDGTYDDHVIATVNGPAQPDGGQAFRVPYAWDDEGGTFTFGTPQQVRLSVVEFPDDADAEMGPDPDAVMSGLDLATAGAKALGMSIEVKAGRVLSGANATRISSAVETLISVLSAAGVQITMPETAAPAESKTLEDAPDSTSTDQVETPVVVVNPAEVMAQALRLRALAAHS